jgi:aarF domain-containing kinase
MRFADFAVDLAAVLNASRSVASKHVALRARQLDRYSKTSSIVASLNKKPMPVNPSAPSDQPKDSHGEASGSSTATQAASATSDIVVPLKPAINSVPRSQFEGSPLGSSASDAILSRTRRESSPTIPGTDSVLVHEALRQHAFRTQETAENKAEFIKSKDEIDIPPGIDINIFHTSRGKNTLGKRAPAPPIQPAVAESDPRPSVQQDKMEATERSISSIHEATKPSIPVPNASDTETPQTFPSPIENELPAPEAPRPVYALRESKVPATRMSRLWNYGGLAAGMLGGAITESINRATGGGGQGSVLLSGQNMERLVARLSKMRGAALKLGQIMSFQDSKMLPGPIQEVLQRVQDRADYMPSYQRDKVLTSNLGSDWRDLFEEFEEKPIAAASIGQVHRAILKDGAKKVAVKIQFPGVADSINSDLDNLSILLTATKLLPKGLYLNKTIDNARVELGWECDYNREAECVQRYKSLLADEEATFSVPNVHLVASGKQVLTMDFMEGVGVTRVASFTQEQKDWIGTQILRLCLREITEFKFMQTDPNWTNFLYNAQQNKLELLDFGASREFPVLFVTQYIQLLAAASRADREAVCELSRSLGYLTGHESKIMLDAHVNSILTLAEPFLASAPEVYDFKDQTITERVKALIPVMLHERLAPPPEETYSLHRKLSGAFLLCAKLGSRVRCRDLFEQSCNKSGVFCV